MPTSFPDLQTAIMLLVKYFGVEKAKEIFHDSLALAKLKAVSTNKDLLRLSQVMVKLGGFIAAAGQLLMKSAIKENITQTTNRLSSHLGRERALEIIQEAMHRAWLTSINTPIELYRFSMALEDYEAEISKTGYELKIEIAPLLGIEYHSHHNYLSSKIKRVA